jgi:hypothetical protein
MNQSLPDRFWAKVERTKGCWLWKASRTSAQKRYGQFAVATGRRPGKCRVAHRVAWELTYGPIPAGMVVCHSCDNGLCVRPDHLFLGTPRANNQDMMAKGRHLPVRGASHPGAKLTEAAVAEIRRRAAQGESQGQLARAYAVAPSLVGRVINGQSWPHVAAE